MVLDRGFCLHVGLSGLRIWESRLEGSALLQDMPGYLPGSYEQQSQIRGHTRGGQLEAGGVSNHRCRYRSSNSSEFDNIKNSCSMIPFW